MDCSANVKSLIFVSRF